jgi:exonuclease 1
MGIQGLLPILKDITRPVHLSNYRGQRVAVDAYSWLHKGAYSCSRELVEGVPTDK